MELDIVWFILVTVLFAGFFCLEGFDYGVGMLVPILGRNDTERQMIRNTVGPVWQGNEVWMITAGGAMFAAFPQVYATLFSGFYLALFLMLMALIARGTAFEFRGENPGSGWRNTWDWLLFAGSLVPALLWGVAVANLMKGVPIDAKMQYMGTFFDLLNVYSITGGLTFLLVFLFHGAAYLSIRVEGELAEAARNFALKVGIPAAVVCLAFAGLTYLQTDLFSKVVAATAFILAIVLFVASYLQMLNKRCGYGFALSALTIVAVTVAFFAGLFPRLMVSSLNPAWSLTIKNAASSEHTLTLMTIAAAILVPVVLLYQGWNYWMFRRRVTPQDLEY